MSFTDVSWLEMFTVLVLSGVIIYLLTSDKPYQGIPNKQGIIYMVGHVVGTLLGLAVSLYISVCVLLIVMAFILSPFLFFSYIMGA